MTIDLCRIYDPQQRTGYRVLVDRLWPRGISKERADLDEWNKDIAPSTALRKWFNHEEDKWTAFQAEYRKELHDNQEVALTLLDHAKHKKPLILLYGAKSPTHNHAVILQEFLQKLVTQ